MLDASKPVTTTSPPFNFKNSTSEIVTVPVKVIAPVLFSILANVPTLKSPSSSVPETYTRPYSSETCSYASILVPPFSGSAR